MTDREPCPTCEGGGGIASHACVDALRARLDSAEVHIAANAKVQGVLCDREAEMRARVERLEVTVGDVIKELMRPHVEKIVELAAEAGLATSKDEPPAEQEPVTDDARRTAKETGDGERDGKPAEQPPRQETAGGETTCKSWCGKSYQDRGVGDVNYREVFQVGIDGHGGHPTLPMYCSAACRDRAKAKAGEQAPVFVDQEGRGWYELPLPGAPAGRLCCNTRDGESHDAQRCVQMVGSFKDKEPSPAKEPLSARIRANIPAARGAALGMKVTGEVLAEIADEVDALEAKLAQAEDGATAARLDRDAALERAAQAGAQLAEVKRESDGWKELAQKEKRSFTEARRETEKALRERNEARRVIDSAAGSIMFMGGIIVGFHDFALAVIDEATAAEAAIREGTPAP